MIQLPDHPDIAYALSHGCAPWEDDFYDDEEDTEDEEEEGKEDE